MSFATNMQSVATTLLTKYGEAISLVNTVAGAYNPTTGEVATGTTTSYTGYGHPSPYKVSELTSGKTDDDILHTDLKVLLKSSTLPVVGDIATMRGIAYRVMSVNHLSAQGLDIVYQLQLRI